MRGNVRFQRTESVPDKTHRESRVGKVSRRVASVYIHFSTVHIPFSAYTHFFLRLVHIHIIYTFPKISFQNLVFACISFSARRRRRQTLFFITYSNFLSFLMLPDMISGNILLNIEYTHLKISSKPFQPCIYHLVHIHTFFSDWCIYTYPVYMRI